MINHASNVKRRKVIILISLVLFVFFLFGVYTDFHFKPGLEILSVKNVSWGDIRVSIINKNLFVRNVDLKLWLWYKNKLVYTFNQEVLLLPFQRRTVVFGLPNWLDGYDTYEVQIVKNRLINSSS